MEKLTRAHAVRAAETKPGTSDRSAARLQLLNHEQSPWRVKSSDISVSSSGSVRLQRCTARPKRPRLCSGAQAAAVRKREGASSRRRPGWWLEGLQPIPAMALLTLALLTMDMLLGMLGGERDELAAATPTAPPHARLGGDQHAHLHGCTGSAYAAHTQRTRSAHAAHTQRTMQCKIVADLHAARMQYVYVHTQWYAVVHAATGSMGAHAARLLCGSQPIVTLVAALAVTRVAWVKYGCSLKMYAVAASNSPRCVTKGCSLSQHAGSQVAGFSRPALLTVGGGVAVAGGQARQLSARRRLVRRK